MAVSDTIWTYDAWRDRTKNVAVLPFHEDATSDQTLNQKDLETIRALASRIHNLGSYKARNKTFMDESHNDQAGKEAWGKWLTKYRPKWKIQQDAEAVLDKHERHPRHMMGGGQGAVGSVSDISEWCVVRGGVLCSS